MYLGPSSSSSPSSPSTIYQPLPPQPPPQKKYHKPHHYKPTHYTNQPNFFLKKPLSKTPFPVFIDEKIFSGFFSNNIFHNMNSQKSNLAEALRESHQQDRLTETAGNLILEFSRATAYRLCYANNFCSDEIEDLASCVIEKVVRHWKSINPDSAEGYIFFVAQSMLNNLLAFRFNDKESLCSFSDFDDDSEDLPLQPLAPCDLLPSSDTPDYSSVDDILQWLSLSPWAHRGFTGQPRSNLSSSELAQVLCAVYRQFYGMTSMLTIVTAVCEYFSFDGPSSIGESRSLVSRRRILNALPDEWKVLLVSELSPLASAALRPLLFNPMPKTGKLRNAIAKELSRSQKKYRKELNK